MALRRCSSFDPNLFVKVFDFFSGCGGASQGFRDAGMEIVFALDKNMDAKRTFTKNFPNATFLSEDIRQVEAKDTQLLVNQAHPNPILFCGCAPCQPFTKQNTIRPQSDKDERIPLILEFLRLIQGCNPDIVFLENVPGIQKV
ncbi:MAG: DNA cytosine methyltransferase, partial [Bacteroidetes bacterium]|nr:DNA cytosine methyltransferase [Bacteroidota bacterium]